MRGSPALPGIFSPLSEKGSPSPAGILFSFPAGIFIPTGQTLSASRPMAHRRVGQTQVFPPRPVIWERAGVRAPSVPPRVPSQSHRRVGQTHQAPAAGDSRRVRGSRRRAPISVPDFGPWTRLRRIFDLGLTPGPWSPPSADIGRRTLDLHPIIPRVIDSPRGSLVRSELLRGAALDAPASKPPRTSRGQFVPRGSEPRGKERFPPSL